MKGELYNYKGELLTQAAIAKLEGISRSTLADWYKKTGDMESAVIGAKKSLAQRNINYNKEILSLKAIATKEKIKFETLKKYYEETDDIYIAVKLTQEAKEKRNGNIEYNGSKMTISAIAKLENLERHSLNKYYKETNDIVEAVKLARLGKEKQRGTIDYNGTLMTITGIAKLEGIKHETLKEFYELYQDIHKAVYITKQSQLKRRKALYKGKQEDYFTLAKQFNMSVLKLNQLIEQGKSIDKIDLEVRGKTKEEFLMYKGISLYRYCLEHSYNYWVILNIINTYHKSVEEAVDEYLINGQQIPTKWIYAKYGILFKHLTLSFGLDSNRIIKIMKNENCNIESAITKLIFTMNKQDNDFKMIELDWLYEVYTFLMECNEEEKKEAIDIFYITDRELQLLNSKNIQINEIKQKLLLFEISELISVSTKEELLTIIELYNLTKDEIKFMITELYKPFDGYIVDLNQEQMRRKEYLNELILSKDIDDNYIINNLDLTDLEKKIIIEKRNLLNYCIKDNVNCK